MSLPHLEATIDFGLPTEYQSFIHLARYARFDYETNARENWDTTVRRYLKFFRNRLPISDEIEAELLHGIYSLQSMPSMRALATAGPALERDHIAGYNCAYIPIDRQQSFDEVLFVLMCGTGVGFSVERQLIKCLPEVPATLHPTETTIIVRDSKLGWAKAFRQLIAMLYAGEVPNWDLSKLRPQGAILKTFGGRSSGPAPLDDLFKFTVKLFESSAGRKLNSIECHDLVCKVGDVVVVGGVRRSALLSLSNLSDDRMRAAKSGQWWETTPHRRLANNSAAYDEHPGVERLMHEWISLIESKSGERGLFNRSAAANQVARNGRRRVDDYKGDPIEWGTNPCSEIILRPYEFCNLSEVVARVDDTEHDLHQKVRMAAILGTMQSTLTDFRYINHHWTENCQEERLLGVSMTGIQDSSLLQIGGESYLDELLEDLKRTAIITNKEFSDLFGINQATAITCVKPSGTVSQLVDASSGIHPRHAKTYIRRVRMDTKDPLTSFMVDAGFPHEPERDAPDHVLVFDFPIRAPERSITGDSITAIEALEHWKIFQDHWCEHKPSITVSVREDEWFQVGAWVDKHFDELSGVSFLPHSDHIYEQAPYETVDEAALSDLEAKMPVEVDWSMLSSYESEDNTESSQELACTAASCEII